jgi:MFS family permease
MDSGVRSSGPETEVRAATRATSYAFIGSGVALSSWAARIPQVRDTLELTPSRLGLVLLAIAAGSIVSLVMAGGIVTRYGSRRTVVAMAVLMGVSLSAAAIGTRFGVLPVVIALVGFGFANGAWDVAMNVQGTVVERQLGRAIMPRFHAGYSVGTVGGAILSAGVVALHISVTAHLVAVALIVMVLVIRAVREFLPDDSADDADGVPENGPSVTGLRRALTAWSEPRTLLIGVFVLAFAFTEGSGIDWINVAVIDDYGASATVGTLAFALFLASMTAGRWFGPAWLDRYGRVPVLRLLAVISLVGLGLFVFGPNTAVAFVGALFWGLGASLGFPVGMSAAADDPAHAAPRVSVVASIGYCAFLGGPPLIGFLADRLTVVKSLSAVAVLLVVALAVAGSIRPPRT